MNIILEARSGTEKQQTQTVEIVRVGDFPTPLFSPGKSDPIPTIDIVENFELISGLQTTMMLRTGDLPDIPLKIKAYPELNPNFAFPYFNPYEEVTFPKGLVINLSDKHLPRIYDRPELIFNVSSEITVLERLGLVKDGKIIKQAYEVLQGLEFRAFFPRKDKIHLTNPPYKISRSTPLGFYLQKNGRIDFVYFTEPLYPEPYSAQRDTIQQVQMGHLHLPANPLLASHFKKQIILAK